MTAQISIHERIKQMHQRLKEAGLSSVAERFQQQERMRCKPCGVGPSCELGTHGPHRVVPRKVERGACGTDAAGMMMRNLICPSVGIGIGAYIFHCKEAAQTLKATAQEKLPFPFEMKGNSTSSPGLCKEAAHSLSRTRRSLPL